MLQSENSKRLIFLNVFSGAGKTIIISLLAIISIPISLNYWGNTIYGFLALINSLLAYLAMSSLGIDAAASILMNKAKTDNLKKSILIQSIKLTIPFVIIMLGLFLVLDYLYPGWVNIVGDIDGKIDSAKQCAFILTLFFILNIVFKLVSAGFNGFHKPYYDTVFQTFTAISNFLVLLIAVYLKLSLLEYSYLIGVTSLLLNVLKALFFYISIYNKITTNSTDNLVREHGDKKLLSLGLQCLLGTVAALVINNTDNVVISKMLGVEYVSTYSVVFKVYTILFSIVYIINSAIIPILGKKIAVKSIEEIENLYFKTFYLIIGFTGFSVSSINFFLPDVLAIWANVAVDYSLIVTFSVFAFFFCITNLNNILTNAFNYVSYTIPILLCEALLNIALSVYLAPQMGVTGIALGTLISTFLCSFILFPVIIYYKTDKKIQFPLRDLLSFSLFVLTPFFVISILVNTFDFIFYRKVLSYLACVFIYFIVIYRYYPKIELERVLTFCLSKLRKERV